MRFALPLALLTTLGLALATTACSSSPKASGGGGSSASSSASASSSSGEGGGTGGAGPTETCTATFRWLQKDAYSDSPGRSTKLWPPHTTTTLDVTCTLGDGQPMNVESAFQANHGTLPTAVDANGDMILVETKRETVTAGRIALIDLVASYSACTCDSATKFLSLDSLQDAAVQDLLDNVATYIQQHLLCGAASGGSTQDLVQALKKGDIDMALQILPSCMWDGGTDLTKGLNQALQTFLDQTNEVLAGYHVCNNDAALQAGLWEGFKTTGASGTCDATTDLCKGPMWFYDP